MKAGKVGEVSESRTVKPGSAKRTSPATFYRQVVAELRKVVWPTRDEATNLTTAVLFVTLLMTLLLGSVDWVFTQLLDWVVRVVSGA